MTRSPLWLALLLALGPALAFADEEPAATVTGQPQALTLAPSDPPGPHHVAGAGDLIWARQNPRPAASAGLGFGFFAGPLAGSGNTMLRGTLALRIAPIKNLDFGIGFLLGQNSNANNKLVGAPTDVLLGFDTFIAARVGFDFGNLSVGGALQGRVRSDIHQPGPAFGGIGARVLADYRLLDDALAIHANLGFSFDNSSSLLPDYATYLPNQDAYRSSTEVSVASLLLSLGVGADYAIGKYLKPFLTAWLDLPVDGCVAYNAMKQCTKLLGVGGGTTVHITPGIRAVPVKGLAIDLQAPIAFGGGSGVPIPPIYTIQLLVSYSFWPGLKETIVVEGPTITGKVISKVDAGPIEGAVITTDDAGIPAAATNARGEFKISHLPAGQERTLRVVIRGYAPNEAKATPDKDPVTVILEPKLENANLSGLVTDLDGKPIKEVSVTIRNTETKKTNKMTGDAHGKYVLSLAPANYIVTYEAPGFLSLGRKFALGSAVSQVFDAALRPRPTVATASLEGERITVAQRINFATGTDKIDLESQLTLEEVASIMLDHPEIEHLEVGGHTDDRGSDSFNQELSERRAKAVVDYLISRGVEAPRLASKGFGKSQPLANAKTDQGRAQNRRVEFLIKQ